jgi:hypothetical protein
MPCWTAIIQTGTEDETEALRSCSCVKIGRSSRYGVADPGCFYPGSDHFLIPDPNIFFIPGFFLITSFRCSLSLPVSLHFWNQRPKTNLCIPMLV